MSFLIQSAIQYIQQQPIYVLTALVGVFVIYALIQRQSQSQKNLPPMVPYWVPFIGSMVSFGLNPLQFMKENREKYGDIYTFLMFGRKMTYLFGPEGNNFVLNSCKLKEVSAEEAYKHLTTPVFGEGVVYDVPNHVLVDQKKFVKHGLSPENLRLYVPMIEQETRAYFQRWKGDQGIGEVAQAIAELTILTASRCLMGNHIREHLSETVAELYCDLDKGFTPLNFLFPNLPLESYRKRDEAHIKMRELFLSIMKDRRENNDMDNFDMLQALMDSEYRDGRKMSDREVACLMIALLMAGQHTSSTTGAWCIAYLAQNPQIIQDLLQEQKSILGENLEAPLDYEALKSMTLLDQCIKETLRLKPPIITLFRKVMEDIEYKGYTIPKGHYIGVAPALSQLDHEIWGNDALNFRPSRFNDDDPRLENAIGHGAQSSYLPFGAGRHRCIGEAFANIQLKTIVATFVQMFDWKFPEGKGFPKTDFTTLIVMPVRPVDVEYTRRQWNKDTSELQKEE